MSILNRAAQGRTTRQKPHQARRKPHHGAGRTAAAAVLGALLLAGCGTDTGKNETLGIFGQTLQEVGKSAAFWKEKPKTAAVDPEAMARSALESNKGPLLLATFESTGYTNIFGMIGENGDMRTYASPARDAIILRGGMMAGTRGFGFDTMSAEVAATARLIHARQSGSARKVVRYLDGLGLERPIPLECKVQAGGTAEYTFIDKIWRGTQVLEQCEGMGVKMTNSYVVSAQGNILASRQWVAPQIGYVVLQTVRP